ncbi:hypothetical protein GQR58_002315 [Nymphon striatum]|nr:hypothetical protein GQR58_002315 [Nymphon striatum]
MIVELAKQDDRIRLTDANVHDILPASIATVSINSTVALEGYMHGVPAILFGKSDFHHIAQTVAEPPNFAQDLYSAMEQDIDFDRYLACGKLHEKIWARFANAGFPKEAFR